MKQQDGNLVGLSKKDRGRLPPSDILLGVFESPHRIYGRANIGSHVGSRAKALTDEWVLCRPPATISYVGDTSQSLAVDEG